jgi:hypothetical protein
MFVLFVFKKTVVFDTIKTIGTFLFLILFITSGYSFDQGIFETLSDENIKNITIESDIENLIENRRDTSKHAAVLSYEDGDKNEIKWDIVLTMRGRYRRMFSKNVPPLKIDFKKKDLKDRGLKKYDDLKLVTIFNEDKKAGLQTLVREYLVYKMYNALNPHSYRVQLLEVKFVDSNSGDSFKEYTFIIEDGDQLEDRLNIKEIKDKIKEEDVEYDDQTNELVAMFEYFIGNGDWSLTQPKNLNLFEKEGKIFAIPYDFDFSGMVSAQYAVPNNLYGRSTVKDRVYLGKTVELSELTEIIQIFKDNREKLLEIVDKGEKLSGANKKEMKEYINSFFEDIEYRIANGHNMKPLLKTLIAAEEKMKQK